MQTRRFSLLLITLPALVLGLVLFTVSPTPVEALTVSPARIEIDANPGNIVRDKFILINEQDITKTFYSSAELFEASGETGTPSFVEGDTGLARWIRTQGQVTLQPGEVIEVPYTIQIPDDAEPGGHFAAIFWSDAPPAGEGGQVFLGSKIGILVLLNVGGDALEGGGIIEAGTQDGKKLFTSLPVNLFYRFQNDGRTRLRPTGEVTFRNFYGRKVTVMQANPTEGNVLPQSIRRYPLEWNSKKEGFREDFQITEDTPTGFFPTAGRQLRSFALGPYSATIDIVYGDDEATSTEKVRFFVLPWQLLTLLLAVFLLIFFGGRFMIRRYNRWVINQAKKALQSEA